MASENYIDAVQCYLEEYDGDKRDVLPESDSLLSEESLKAYNFASDYTCEDDELKGMTFAEALKILIDRKVKFPTMFASTEY